jgi:drug/metabolite transporter (DMT)-like permease
MSETSSALCSDKPAGATYAQFQLSDLGMLLVVLIWGANVTVVKVALEALSPLAFNALRFGIATILFVALQLGRERSLRISRQFAWRALWLGVVGNCIYQVCFVIGLNATTAANAALLLATVPIWVALIGAISGSERLAPMAWLGIGLSFVGIVLVLIAQGVALSLATLGGDLLVLASSLCWAIYTLGARPLLKQYSALRTMAVTMLTGTPFLILVALPALIAQPWAAVPLAGWGGLVFSAVFAIVVAYWIWYSSVQRIGAARTGVYSNLVPVIAVVIAWLARGEAILPLQILGAIAIIVGIWLTQQGSRS